MPEFTNVHRGMLLVTLFLVVGVAGTACSKSSSTTSPAVASPAGSAQVSAGGGGVTLEQGLGDALVFTPTKLTVKQGDTITVSNVGTMPHTFTVTDQSIRAVNTPGQSKQVKIDLAPGTYAFVCTYHAASGMTGTLVVK